MAEIIIQAGQTLSLDKWIPAAEFPIGCLKDIQTTGTPMHRHDFFFELVVVVNGTGKHRCNDTVFQIAPGDIFLVHPEEKHGYTEVQNLEIFNVIFTENVLNILKNDLSALPAYKLLIFSGIRKQPLHLDDPDLLKVLEDLRLMSCLTNSTLPGSKTRRLSLFLSFMVQISTLAHLGGETVKSENLNIVSELLTNLEQDYTSCWTIEKMANFCRMSESNFRHEFKRLTGVSPVRYLVDLRLGKAMLLLYTHRKSISETAYAVGFNDLNYFIRQFRKAYGTTPSKISRFVPEK